MVGQPAPDDFKTSSRIMHDLALGWRGDGAHRFYRISQLVHKEVVVAYGPNGTTYDFAWVCTDCSAAYPIAVNVSGFFGRSEPMYQPLDVEE